MPSSFYCGLRVFPANVTELSNTSSPGWPELDGPKTLYTETCRDAEAATSAADRPLALDTAVIYTRTVYTRVVYTLADYTAPDCTEVGQTEVDTQPGYGTMRHGRRRRYCDSGVSRRGERGRVLSSVFNQLSVIMRRMEMSKEAL